MKRFIILFACIVATTLTTAFAKDYGVAFREAMIARDGDNLRVSFTIDSMRISTNDRVLLTPVIYDAMGHVKELKPIMLVGKQRNIYDQRAGNMTPNIERHIARKNSHYSYVDRVPYEDWMQYVSLSMSETLEGCCQTTTQVATNEGAVAKGLLAYYQMTPHFLATPLDYELSELEQYDIENPFLHPMEDYENRYDVLVKDRDNAAGKVLFKVGKSDIDMSMANNAEMLDLMTNAFRVIERDTSAILRKIVIAAYASPEGTLAFNTRLAAARAMSVQQYFLNVMDRPDPNLFELINGREDWVGLRQAVDKSTMPEKAQILNIIDSYSMEQEVRKTRLQQLNGGAPYKYMLENFYPPLRNGGYLQIFYEVQRKTAVSWTDSRGREVWIDPNLPRNQFVTAYNKSAGLLVDGNYEEVLTTLLPHKDDSRAWNYLGVAYMMKGDKASATSYFQKAQANGDKEAAKNLEEISWSNKIKM
ncbi:MAG: hypothetical protein LBM62_02020 [Mediterranea sp.]|jgi:outer membrane protein OmpA-like peptidoglycan-associated protein|nr:hypothetical protein [Mediterranea sp.]